MYICIYKFNQSIVRVFAILGIQQIIGEIKNNLRGKEEIGKFRKLKSKSNIHLKNCNVPGEEARTMR